MDGDSAIVLAPGSYHFYYLPHSLRALSAEQQESIVPGGSQASVLSVLAEANGFSMVELEANRQGRLVGGQRVTAARGFILMGLIAAALVVASISALLHSSPQGFVVLILVLLSVLFIAYQRLRDVTGNQVLMMEGVVTRSRDAGDGSPVYYYTLDTKNFGVSWVAYNALIPGERYRVYYLPRINHLVGIEPVT